MTHDYGVGMQCRINEVVVDYVEHGSGVPLVALHGAGVDHREIEAAIEAVVPSAGYRRIYPDLPGMGRTASDGLTCNDDVVTLLGDFLAHLGAARVSLGSTTPPGERLQDDRAGSSSATEPSASVYTV